MKKLLLILFATSIWSANAQTILLQEDFTSYAGTLATVPAGWAFSAQACYTTVASSGTSGPNSFKFGSNGAMMNSPMFAMGADSLQFWMKFNGSSTPANDTMSVFYIWESADSTTFTIIDSLRPISSTGKTMSYALNPMSMWVMFSYKKVGGNVAFDDLKVIQNAPASIATNTAPANDINFSVQSSVVTLRSNTANNNLIETYSLSGQLISSLKMTGTTQQIDLSAQSKGIYIFRITNDKGTVVKKIMVD